MLNQLKRWCLDGRRVKFRALEYEKDDSHKFLPLVPDGLNQIDLDREMEDAMKEAHWIGGTPAEDDPDDLTLAQVRARKK